MISLLFISRLTHFALFYSFRFGANRSRTVSGGSTSSGDGATAAPPAASFQHQHQQQAPHLRRSSGGGSGFFSGKNSSRDREKDAQMERLVATAARELGDGVQKIVLAAKARQGNSEWKSDLLRLLGNDAPTTATTTTTTKSQTVIMHRRKTSRVS